ncbi:helix-turn-helix transcriptional regulator [Actinobacillus porcinus]|uniref:helix-turn-helix transcriptional regulator n=1 Tax=Actinobacillus porcinus TaxID=51048 RepID=UPI002355020D|nr:helix-turn-helix domain-containing protein [Actinobacillus porcinus]
MTINHPGFRIKNEVLPSGMSVTNAAKLLEVGRPALSNLLNGNAKLSPQMAQRLSQAFNFPLEKLMQWQSEYDESLIQKSTTPITHTYAPPFLNIKANDIENWINTDEIQSRSRLAVLLRMLVHSTAKKLLKVNFPGNDDSQRPGWDGEVLSNEATPWIPEGLSGWEFGVNADISKKATADFNKSVNAYTDNSINITFIFVTPRRWIGKEKWVRDKKSLNKWKDVRVYDASDLEQWLEQSLSTQSWLANEAKLPTKDVESLDSFWNSWANVCQPRLIPSFFTKLMEKNKQIIENYLTSPPSKPFYIAADSTDEAIAFLSSLFSENSDFINYRDRCLLFKQTDVLPHLAEGTKNFIAITANKDVEKELAQYVTQIHSFIVCSKNSQSKNADLTLEILDSSTFIHALEKMGKNYDESVTLANKAGYSLTVLRRQLSLVEAIKNPNWVNNSNRELIPFLFAGTWDSSNKKDIAVLESFTDNQSYRILEENFSKVYLLNDSPVWKINNYRGVVSRIDLLFAIAPYITKSDLECFFENAELILSEDDPALDLPENEQWRANLLNKKREYSQVLRDSFSEMIILLGVHGNELFKDEFDCDIAIEKLIYSLLTPLTVRKLQANADLLSTYAEASPNTFLTIIENDLKAEKHILEILIPTTNTLFSSPKYTDLLWALEKLAWDEYLVSRVVKILAQLSEKEIDDNYANKPFSSLCAIFRSWLPITNASLEQRILLLKKLVKDFPEIGWRVCLSQFPKVSPQIALPSSKYIWRNIGEQRVVTYQDVYDFCNTCVNISLNWPEYTFEKLCDLVNNIHYLDTTQQDKLWELLKNWSLNKATESEKIEMREKLRTNVLSRRAKKQENRVQFTKLGEQVYVDLSPKDPIDRNIWLFREHWVNESADELEDIRDLSFDEREELIRKERTKALESIIEEKGNEGVLDLCLQGNAAHVVGFLLRRYIFSTESQLVRVIIQAMNRFNISQETRLMSFIRGILCESKENTSLFGALDKELSESDMVKIYLQAPFISTVWEKIDLLSESLKKEYWANAIPNYWSDKNDVKRGVQYLLEANRGQTAFSYISLFINDVESELIFEVLSSMISSSTINENLPPDSYHLGKAFSRIKESKYLTLEQKAGLEFSYIYILAPYGRRNEYCDIENLEMYIEQHPDFFIYLISSLYKRDDGNEDENINKYQTEEERDSIFKQYYYTLEALRFIPGQDKSGNFDKVKLEKWIDNAIEYATKEGRRKIAEYFIGKLLSHSAIGKDNIWPCEEIRDILEDFQSDNMCEGMYIGKKNGRGVTTRSLGDGGTQERKLVEQYNNWGKLLTITHPFVASKLLYELAHSYQYEAKHWDSEHRLRMHLR